MLKAKSGLFKSVPLAVIVITSGAGGPLELVVVPVLVALVLVVAALAQNGAHVPAPAFALLGAVLLIKGLAPAAPS
jgi:hypothetical protein